MGDEKKLDEVRRAVAAFACLSTLLAAPARAELGLDVELAGGGEVSPGWTGVMGAGLLVEQLSPLEEADTHAVGLGGRLRFSAGGEHGGGLASVEASFRQLWGYGGMYPWGYSVSAGPAMRLGDGYETGLTGRLGFGWPGIIEVGPSFVALPEAEESPWRVSLDVTIQPDPGHFAIGVGRVGLQFLGAAAVLGLMALYVEYGDPEFRNGDP